MSNCPKSPDLTDPRYLDEVGYFLYYEKEMRWEFESYDEERRTYSRLHLTEVLEAAGEDESWIKAKRVVNIGAGCSCAVLAWPCRSKVSLDPLIDTYGRLGMLIEDAPGTPTTTFLSASAEDIPLPESSCDLAYCRNALDHMHHPERAVEEIARIVSPGGYFYLDVDLEGDPTPDEPSSLTEPQVLNWLSPWFATENRQSDLKPFSINSRSRIRLFLRRYDSPFSPPLDKSALFQSYNARVESEKKRK